MAIGQTTTVSKRGQVAPPSPVRKLTPLAVQARARGVKIYHVNIGQPDIPIPAPMLEAIQSFHAETLGYAPSRGMTETIDAWRQYYGTFGFDVPVEQVLVTTGGSEALWFAFMAVADHGDEILFFEPTYANYFGFTASTGIHPVAISLDPEDGFHLPPHGVIEAHLSPRTRAICIANPNNPTGTVYDRRELEMLVDVALSNGLFIIADETYRELVFDGLEHVGLLEFTDSLDVAEKVIIVDSVSKRFSATGARVGCLVSRNLQIMDATGRFAQARLSSPTVEQLAVVPMLSNPTPYTNWLRGVYQDRRDAVFQRVSATPNISCRKPSGAFYIMVTLPIADCDDFAKWLLTDFESNGETIMIAPGAGFYFTPDLGKNLARIAYVLREEHLVRAVDILQEALACYPGALR
jgi:aspartate aminotransferase